MSAVSDNLISIGLKSVARKVRNRVISYLRGPAISPDVSRNTVSFHSGSDSSRLKTDFDVAGYDAFCRKYPGRLDDIVTEHWGRSLKIIEKHFRRKNAGLFYDPAVRFAIFLDVNRRYQERELPYLRSIYEPDELQKLLVEDHVLRPLISDVVYNTSEMLVHHLTHLTVYRQHTGNDPFRCANILEFGGGYGGMCRLICRVPIERTYIITDLPLMLFLQSYYLKNILGKDAVNLVTDDEFACIRRNKINLVPIFFDHVLCGIRDHISPDLFISTWSLSEATPAVQQKIRDFNFMNAGHILHGYYGDENNIIPFSQRLDIFSKYVQLYHSPAFYDDRQMERYLFLKKRT